MIKEGSFSDIPIVDLSARQGTKHQRAELSEHIRHVFHHVGFMVVTGHGIDAGVTEAAFDRARAFFALPLESKLSIDKRSSRHFRGWEPEGAEYTNARPDIREQIDLWTEHPPRGADVEPVYFRLLGANQWPDDALITGFRTSIERWIGACRDLSQALMALLAQGLGLESDHFEKLFGSERMSLTKIIRYPATPAGEFGVNPHHDAGFLTVLAPGDTPGLEVENDSGDWITVPLVENGLVINIGEMLQSITGNYYVATPHRVTTTRERFSMGYFHGPALDTPLVRLPLDDSFAQAVASSPRHANAGFMAQRDETKAGIQAMQSQHHPETYGGQLWNYFSRSYPDNVAKHYPDSVRVIGVS